MSQIPPRPIDLEAMLRAHPFITIERPPLLWKPDADDETFIRLFGEMIAASLARNGGVLSDVTINVSNVVIEPDAAGPMPAGKFVAITARGRGDWGPQLSRRPDPAARPSIVSADVENAAASAGVIWAYTRDLGHGTGSVTMLFGV